MKRGHRRIDGAREWKSVSKVRLRQVDKSPVGLVLLMGSEKSNEAIESTLARKAAKLFGGARTANRHR